MPKSDEARAIEALTKAVVDVNRTLTEIRDELRGQRRDAQRPVSR